MTSTIIGKLRRNGLRFLIALLIVTVAASALYYVLRDIAPDQVVAALKAQSGRCIAIACIFVVAGYVTLTFYDYFALRTIDRPDVPFAVAAFASFTSYTIGHTLGAATVTGGAVRLRIYSAWGLTVLDIAKIAFVTGMTFWLGNAVVLGSALTYAPEAASAVDRLPIDINRFIGVSALLAYAGYLLWLLPRQRFVGYRDWRIALPNVRFTLIQSAIGATDLCLVTLAIYVLLPAEPAVDFPAVLVIFLTATLLGTVSHAPGSIGVLEAAILFGLPQFPKEKLLATLLIFRVLYFLIPLCFATLIFSFRELRVIVRPTLSSFYSRYRQGSAFEHARRDR